MGKVETKKQKKKYLLSALIINFGLLFIFKYLNFFSDNLEVLFTGFDIFPNIPHLRVLLPVGISFYTFQTVGYLVEVYKGKFVPEKHFGIFALYVSFFPQLVAGPIERAQNLLPQLWSNHKFNYTRVTDGLKIMLWGFFLKVVIADRLAIVVDTVYNNVHNYTGFPLILATYFFAFQIYCDFAGYSFIAIGAAKVLGINLMDNFRRPYYSKSIQEFWKRWHISLSTWFMDYLYIPLGGNRATKQRWFFNLLVVFVIVGLWHGSAWTFIIWGTLHGLFYIFSTFSFWIRISEFLHLTRFPKIHNLIKVLITFHLVLFSWIFFRANSLSDVSYILLHLFTDLSFNFEELVLGLSSVVELRIAILSILFMEFVHLIQERSGMRKFLSSKPIWIRWPIYLIVIISIYLFGVYEETPFIYFQF